MIRKGQTKWVSGSDVRRQIQFIHRLFEVASMRRSPADSPHRSLAALGKLQHIRSIGYAPNRWLANIAANPDKPDGLTVLHPHKEAGVEQ